jgi:competence protein ComEA
MTKDRWGSVVDDMVSRGATGTDDEIDQVIAYLATNFSRKKVNVNKASATDIAAALEISPADAAAIVAYRTDKGNFKEIQDITKVPGIDTKKIEAAKDRLEF